MDDPVETKLIAALFELQGGSCFHCSGPMMRGARADCRLRWTREHLHPKGTQERLTDARWVLAHSLCNNRRGSRILTTDELGRAEALFALLPPSMVDHGPSERPVGLRYGIFLPSRALGSIADVWPQLGSLGSRVERDLKRERRRQVEMVGHDVRQGEFKS